MSNTALKYFGIVAMTIDHIGKAFFSQELFLQIIGRVAFPIFAYCLVFGYLSTQSLKSYALRLFLIALISQPLYVLAFDYDSDFLNIFFTLLLALLALELLRRRWYLLFLIWLLICPLLKIEFGVQGILLVCIFYIFRQNRSFSLVFASLYFTSLIFIDMQQILSNSYFHEYPIWRPSPSLNMFGILALPLLYIPMNIKLREKKLFFYAFYPAHLLLILFMQSFM